MMRTCWLLFLLPLAGCGGEVDAGEGPVFQGLAAQTSAPAAALASELSLAAAPAPALAPGVSALLYSDLDAELTPRIEGVVSAVLVELGDRVQSDQVLAVLEDGREKARVASARAALELARTEHARGVTLQERDLIPRAEYETMQYRLRAAEASLREAEVELGYTRITAPFAGVVTRRHTGIGRAALEGEPLFRVTALAPLRVLLRLPETQAYALPVGSTVIVQAGGGAQAEGRVARISPAVDPASGTTELLVDVPRPGALRPGAEVLVRLPAPVEVP